MYLRHLLSYLLKFSHGSRAEATSKQPSQEERKKHPARSRHQERRQRHQNHIKLCNAMTTSVLYNTTTTTTGAHPVASSSNAEIQQVTNDINAQQTRQNVITARVRRAGDFLVTSSCTRQSQTANQTTYYVDFNGRTCWEMYRQLRHQYADVYNNTPCYKVLYILDLDGQRHHTNNSFKNGYKKSRLTRWYILSSMMR